MNLFHRKPKTQDYTSNYDALLKQFEAVVEINNAMSGVLKRDDILDLVTSKLISVLGVSFADILVWNAEEATLSVANVSAPKSAIVLTEKALGKPFSSIKFYANKDTANDYIRCIQTNEIIESKNLSSLSEPLLNAGISGIVQRLLSMKLAVSVPLYVREQKLGVLGLIWNKDSLTEQDRSLIKTFATQISNTLYNSYLFNKIQTQVTQLEHQNSDLSSLFNLTTRIVQSLDPKKVTQNAVDSLPQNDFMVGGMILDFDEKARTTKVIATTQNELSEKVGGAIGDFSRYVTNVDDANAQESPAIKAIKLGEMAYADEIHSILTPLPKPAADLVAKLIDVKSVVAYPIRSRGKVVGAITYFLKGKKYEELENNKKQLLTTYTLQISIALENANLYSESQVIQQNLQDALYQLKEARRQERDMLDVMGHELRTPISIVRNALVMLDKQIEEHKATNVGVAKYLDMALESTRREITLIETLLSATKVDASRMQLYFTKVDFKDVVSDGIEGQSNPLNRKSLEILYTPPAEDLFIYADRTRMQEIMDNLYSNAIKYTNKGHIEIKLWQDGKNGLLSIADTGVGISPEDLQQLGHKFFRAKQYVNTADGKDEVIRPGGTGLGLYVTFDLIRIMGGMLYINSKVGEGTKFTVVVPLFAGQPDKQVDETFDNEDSTKHDHIILNGNPPQPQ